MRLRLFVCACVTTLESMKVLLAIDRYLSYRRNSVWSSEYPSDEEIGLSDCSNDSPELAVLE